MASNKNQHFVPKVYLRRFSPDPEGASINLFNLARHRSISCASTKGQCSSNLFYGEDELLEEALQTSERRYGAFLRELDDPDFELTGDHKILLQHVVLLQHMRTSAAVQRHMGFLMDMVQTGFEGNPPPHYLPNAKETVLTAMKTFRENMHILDDLKVKLVRNRTRTDFITSDNPSVQTNRWHIQSPKARGQSPGMSNAGIVFLMPVSPRHLALLYDGDVYTVENARGWVDVTQLDDVESLNEHQFLDCDANVYFSDWSTSAAVEAAYDRISNRRPAVRHELITAILDSVVGDHKRYKAVPHDQARGKDTMMHIKITMSVPSRWPRFLRFRSDPRIYSNGTGTGFVRASTMEQGGRGTGYTKVK